MKQTDQKSKSLSKAIQGRIKSLVKNISRESSISEKDRNSSESETTSQSSKESNKESNDDEYKRRIKKLRGGTSDSYLSRSDNCLSHSSDFNRNSSDSRLSERNTRCTQAGYSRSFPERKRVDTELRDKGVQTCSTSLTTEIELDEAEPQKPKALNLKGTFGRRVRGSLRLMKVIRQKSGSDNNNSSHGKTSPSEKYKLFRQLATSVLDSIQPPANLYLQPPAPLVVEDPPSTDDEVLHDLRKQNPAFLNGSSGNFGNTGPRSAPTTPQGQLGAPQGGLPEPLPSPTIQRSPSHTVFSKPDKINHIMSLGLKFEPKKPTRVYYTRTKATLEDEDSSDECSDMNINERTNLKTLSTSTPIMTAQGQLAEPPSPKATKDPKVHTTSKWRQKKFLRHFPNVEEDEKVLNHYSCALIGDILLQGHLYITKNYFAFYSNVFGYVTKLLIPILTVEEITKEKTARIIPNAIGITTNEDKHIFGSLMSRDSTLAYMKTVWEKAKSEEALPEPEITEPDPDSSESIESGRESPGLENMPSGTDVLASAKFDRIRKESVRNQNENSLLERKGSKGLIRTLKDAITEFRKLPRQSLILVATTLLLVLLFLSAAVLLYRINKIQNQYSVSLQGATLSSTSEDIYSDLLQWQTHLHSRSADAVNNLLDNNLEQIAKVRQSLEALSTLLMGQSSTSSEDIIVSPTETDNPEFKEPVASQTYKNDS